MRNKIIATVIAALIVGPFAYLAVADATSIKKNLDKQNKHIQTLNVEYTKLDKELEKTEEVKEQTVQEVQYLEQLTQSAALERQRLESELGPNL